MIESGQKTVNHCLSFCIDTNAFSSADNVNISQKYLKNRAKCGIIDYIKK